MPHNPSNNNCPRNADPRNEACDCDWRSNPKPNVSRLMEAFQSFAIATHRAGINRQRWEEARESLRLRLEELGIAQEFDWSEE